MTALKFIRKPQEEHKENAIMASSVIWKMVYKAELSHTFCIHFLHHHKKPWSDLQLADT